MAGVVVRFQRRPRPECCDIHRESSGIWTSLELLLHSGRDGHAGTARLPSGSLLLTSPERPRSPCWLPERLGLRAAPHGSDSGAHSQEGHHCSKTARVDTCILSLTIGRDVTASRKPGAAPLDCKGRNTASTTPTNTTSHTQPRRQTPLEFLIHYSPLCLSKLQQRGVHEGGDLGGWLRHEALREDG